MVNYPKRKFWIVWKLGAPTWSDAFQTKSAADEAAKILAESKGQMCVVVLEAVDIFVSGTPTVTNHPFGEVAK
jgi:hypothetical protein